MYGRRVYGAFVANFSGVELSWRTFASDCAMELSCHARVYLGDKQDNKYPNENATSAKVMPKSFDIDPSASTRVSPPPKSRSGVEIRAVPTRWPSARSTPTAPSGRRRAGGCRGAATSSRRGEVWRSQQRRPPYADADHEGDY
ncbi:unnamed protein product, partial [Iphiclides podalirius]